MKYFSKKDFYSSVAFLLIGFLIVLLNLAWLIPTIGTMRHQISENEVEIVKRSQSEVKFFLDNQTANLTLPALFLNPDLGHPDNKAIVEKILNNPYFNKASLFDKNGRELFRADRFATVLETALENLSEKQEFITVINSGLPFFGDIRFTETLEPLSVVAVPVYFVRGEVAGVLSAELNIRALFSSLDSIRSVSGGHVYVVDKNGDLIFHRDPSLVLQQTNRSSLKIVDDILSGKEDLAVSDDDSYTYENEKKEKVLAAGGLIKETGWAVVFEEPKRIAMAPIEKIKLFALVVAFLGALILIVLNKLNRNLLNSKKELERAFNGAKRLADGQSVVALLGQKALGNSNIIDLMNETVKEVSQVLGTEYVKILELEPDGKNFILRAGVGWKAGFVGQAKIPAGPESQAGYTLLSEKPVVVEDLTKEKRFNAPALLKEHNVKAGMSVIIQGSDRPFGVLGVHTSLERTFSEADINFIQSVANVLSEAIERKKNEEIVKNNAEELGTMNKFMVGRELKMIELKKEIEELKKCR